MVGNATRRGEKPPVFRVIQKRRAKVRHHVQVTQELPRGGRRKDVDDRGGGSENDFVRLVTNLGGGRLRDIIAPGCRRL